MKKSNHKIRNNTSNLSENVNIPNLPIDTNILILDI